jgi:hypothetical protein
MNQETRKAGSSVTLHPFLILPVRLGLPGFLISASVCLLLLPCALGGDAVAIGYNAEGVWTSVTYFCSGKPKGSPRYKNEVDAREEALRDLRKRDGGNLTRAEILSSSDTTGFVAVGRGTDKSRKDQNVVGRWKTQAEADQNASAQLHQGGATKNQKIVYRYFSHGGDGR